MPKLPMGAVTSSASSLVTAFSAAPSLLQPQPSPHFLLADPVLFGGRGDVLRPHVLEPRTGS